MSGNRKKQKNGLFVAGAVLLTSLCSYGLEKSQFDLFTDDIWNDVVEFGHNLDSSTHKDKAALITSLNAAVGKIDGLIPTIPNTPPADPLFKTILQDLHDGLEATHATLSTAQSITEIRSSGAASCSIQNMLEKTKNDLDVLINHVKAHPDLYSQELSEALVQFRKTKFQKSYDEWFPRGWDWFFLKLNKYYPLIRLRR